MRLKKLRRRAGGTIDRRGAGGGSPIGMGGMPIAAGGGGLLVLIAVVVVMSLLTGGGDPTGQAPAVGGAAGGDPETREVVDAVVDDIQTTWDEIFTREGQAYQDTDVVLFDDVVASGCGRATSAVGPFYCPLDQLIYLDLGFFRELEQRFGAAGDFAEAYVIAHEVGHHVQHLLGAEQRVRRDSEREPSTANDLSVRLELQADCYAGVWGRAANAEGILQPGDLQEGLQAAAAIGDDRIQEKVEGRVDPESWTHGSSEMRVRWLETGYQIGNPDACDTFSVPSSEL